MHIDRKRKLVLVCLSITEALLFGGIQFGWPQLQVILMDEGLFHELCQNYTCNCSDSQQEGQEYEISCKERDERFNLIITLTITIHMVVNIANGSLCNLLGTKKARMINIRMVTGFSPSILNLKRRLQQNNRELGGAFLVGFSSKELPWLILPGLIMIANSGLALLVTNMQVVHVLPKGSSIYLGLINGCYDASSAVNVVVMELYQKSIPKLYSYIGISGLCLSLSSLCTVFHAPFEKLKEKRITQENDNDPEKENMPTLCSAFRSRTYILHIMWSSFLVLRFAHFIGSIYTHIERITGTDAVSYYTNILGYIMFGGILSSFMAGYLLEIQSHFFEEKMQNVLPLAVTSCLAILLSSLMLIEDTDTFYLLFVLVTMLRSFIFPISMNVILSMYPRKHISVLYSVTIAFSGLFSLVQNALYSWSRKYDDASFHVNIFFVVISIITLVHPINVWKLASKRKHNDPYSTVDLQNE